MLTPHPLALLLPAMRPAEYEALKVSIQENGLLEPIVTIITPAGRQILDGRHRHQACLDIGETPKFVLYQGPLDEPSLIAYVLDKNLRRRHLDDSQRAMVAEKVATMRQGERTDLAQNCATSQAQAAERLSVSRRSVQQAAVVRSRGVPELSDAVEEGEVPVSVAAKVAVLPVVEQARFLVELGEGEKPAHQVLAAMQRDAARASIVEAAREAPPWPGGKRYAVILADPPWRYEDPPQGHTGRSIENHYPTMSLEEICALRVADLAARDCMLFLWVPWSQLPAGMRVIEAWGFKYLTGMVWVKESVGLGYRIRNQHEGMLISYEPGDPDMPENLFLAMKGDVPLPEPSARPSSVIFAPREAHSKKPDQVYTIIEQMYPGLPKLELFARQAQPGWDVWGWEAGTSA